MYHCGIDVAKRSHVAAVIDEERHTIVAPFLVTNTRAGFNQLLGELAPLRGHVRVGLEATGHYWLSVYDILQRNGYPVVVINPLAMHGFRKLGMRRRKTDRIDALKIADYLRATLAEPSQQSVPWMLQLKELARFRFRLTQQIGDAKRKIVSVLDRAFPEYETLFSDVFLASSRQLLAEAVSAQEFAEFDLQELSAKLHAASRGRFGLEQARALQQLAQESIGISFMADALQLEMRCLLEQITLLERQRDEVDGALAALMAQQAPSYLQSIPGVGAVSAVALTAEIGDIARFPDADHLVSYAGIDPSMAQSGEFEGDQAHMSKRGSPYLRYALWQATLGAIRYDLEIKAYYEAKRAEGKPYAVAMGAACNKLLRRVYVILKEQRPYVRRP
jgi:transposase